MRKSIVQVSPSTTVKQAAILMRKNSVGSVLVNNGQDFIGIVTETDIVQKAVAQDLSPQITRVESVMSYPLITITADDEIGKAAEMMVQNGVRHLAVTQQGQAVGMISMRDLFHALLTSNESG
jgi:signal-transduction protein with cAMP-binding, CBS, and nucleotidyltransferase domain